jgi:hypothetical protein
MHHPPCATFLDEYQRPACQLTLQFGQAIECEGHESDIPISIDSQVTRLDLQNRAVRP